MDLFGVFAIAHLRSAGAGSVYADPFGAGLVYYGETTDLFVASNRATIVARALGHPGADPARDPLGVGWLCFFNHIIGDATSYEGVQALSPGGCIEINAAGNVGINQAPPGHLWTGELMTASSEAADATYRDLIANVVAVANLGASRRLFRLSGGKDSRLVLALALDAGLQDRFEFETNGDEAQPDVVVARELAGRFDLRHRVRRPAATALGSEEYLERVRLHVHQTSGMLGASYLRGGAGPLVDYVTVGGMFGETMRSHYAKARTIDRAGDLEWFFAHEMPFDAAGILRPEVTRFYLERVGEWIREQLDDGVAPADVPDVFYLRHRIPRWVGTMHEVHNGMLVYPLQSVAAARWAAAAGPRARKIDDLHFRLMRRAQPLLTKMRFAEDAWHEETYGRLPDADDYRAIKPCEASVRLPPRGSAYPAIRECLKDYLLADPSHPAFEVIDRLRLAEAVRHGGKLPATARVALSAALGIGVWLARDERVIAFDHPAATAYDDEPLLRRSRERLAVGRMVSVSPGRPLARIAPRLLLKHLRRRLARQRFVRRLFRGRERPSNPSARDL